MNLNDLKKAWENLSKTVDLSPIRTEKQYKKMVQLADMLSDVVASSKKHALLDLFELVSELIRTYEYEHFRAPDAKPEALLAFLMEQHQLKQSDLPEVGSQGVVSELLRGNRELNIRQIKALSDRFHVPAGLFI